VVQLLYVGLGCLVSSLVLAWLVSDVAFLAVTLLLAALMLILPAVLYATLELATKVLGPIRSAVPMISLGELRSMPTRSIAVTATGAIAVFGSVSILGARGDLQRGLDRSTHDVNAYADVWVAPIGATNMLSTTPFGGDAAQRIGALSNVRAVRPYHGGFLDVGDRRVWVIAPSADARRIVPESQILHGDLGQTNRRLREGGWAIVSEAVATEAHVTPGDRFTVPSPHPVSLRVAAISTNLGWPPGALLLNGRDYRHAWGNPEPTAYHVLLAAGVPPERGRSEIQRALDDESALLAETRSERESRHHALSRQALQRLSQLGTLVVIAAALAMAAATGGMVWQRRRRLAALKLDGFDDGTVWRALLLESALLLGTGCLAGALLGLCGQQLLDRQLATVTGFPVVHTVSVGLALVSFALVTAVAVTIAGLPGYLAARVAPSTALQD
jgi:putative ABC transport system permease protein